MPTPFMHLAMATRLLQDPQLPPGVRRLLQHHQPAFLLGNIAPDAQVLSTIKRRVTHFYGVPRSPDDIPDASAFAQLLAQEPDLQTPRQLSPDMAVFVAGYGVHLQFDLVWEQELLSPHFRFTNWQAPVVRYTAHNTLLTYLDRQAQADLPSAVGPTLQQAEAAEWLSFLPKDLLLEWRDFVAQQLTPTAKSRTVAIYAERMGMSPAEFAANLDNTAWMETHVFHQVAREKIEAVHRQADEGGRQLLKTYLVSLPTADL